MSDPAPAAYPVVVHRRALETPDAVYLREVGGGTHSYADVDRRARVWARYLDGLGVRPGDRVITMFPTAPDGVYAWLAVGWLRAWEVPFNNAYVGSMLAYVVQNSKATTALIDERFLGRFLELEDELPDLQRIVVIGGSGDPAPATRRIEVLIDPDPGDDPLPADEQPTGRDIACIMYTSGTTGPSKGVIVPWAQLYVTATGVFPEVDADDSYYCPFPLCHVSGKHILAMMAIYGGTTVLRDGFSTSAFWGDIAEHGCTMTMLLGATANFLYRQPPSDDDARTPLAKVHMVPVIPEVPDFIERFGVKVATIFAMSEVSCPIQSGWITDDSAGCGWAREGFELRIVDEDDFPVADGEPGELVVRADEPWALMAGYWGMPDETVDAWRNQWFHTGDVFRKAPDGSFHFLDRQKDSIRRRGENISSFEVEAAANQFPALLESAAIAVPSEWGEDDVLLAFVTKPGQAADAEEVFLYLTDRLPYFMVPRYLVHVDELPRTETQKIQKHVLRAGGLTDRAWDREPNGYRVTRGGVRREQV